MYVADWPHINSCTNHFLFLYLQLISFIELFYGKKMVRKKKCTPQIASSQIDYSDPAYFGKY